MVLLQQLGMGAYVLASLLVGARLLLLARRSRGLPEILLGSALLLGAAAFALTALARAVSPAAMPPVRGLSLLVMGTCSSCLWLFTWRVFHPTRGWAAVLCALGVGAALPGLVPLALETGFRPGLAASPWFWISFGGRSLCFAWGAWESLRYHARLRRRLRLGLADPDVVHRFLHWGLASGAATAIFAVTFANQARGHEFGIVTDPFSSITISLLGLTTAVTLALAFFPLRRAIRRAATA